MSYSDFLAPSPDFGALISVIVVLLLSISAAHRAAPTTKWLVRRWWERRFIITSIRECEEDRSERNKLEERGHGSESTSN